MSNTLTAAQIASFDTFATDVKAFLDNNSTETKNKAVRIVGVGTFLDIWKIVGRPCRLAPVMQTQKYFAENGFTKSKFQLRNADGTLRVDENGDAVYSRTHVRLYRAESYREQRSKLTGLTTPETIYGILWQDVPSDMQTKIRQWYFPNAKNSKGETLPSFTPSMIGLVLRKGKKTPKGERRHSWAGFDFVVGGFYGDEKIPAIIPQIAVANKPYLTSFSEYMGCACPDWGQNEGVSEDLSKAACGIYSNLELLF